MVNRRILIAGSLAIAVIHFGSPEVRAGLVYELLFDQASYSGATGGSVAVGLILRETATSPDANLITNTNGVTTGNVQVNWDGGLAGARVTNLGDVSNGPGFISAGGTLTPATDVEILQLSFGATGSLVSAGVREVNLGTLAFTLPATPSITTINFSDPRVAPFDDLVIGSGTSAVVIDTLVSYGSATINAIPEPSSFGLLALVISGVAACCVGKSWWAGASVSQ